MNAKEIDFLKYVKSYPDFPQPGILFRDIFPLIAKVDIFRAAIDQIAEMTSELAADKILAIDARGFIVGTALSLKTGISVVPARKPGKLPGKNISYSYDLEYGTDCLQLPRGAISAGERVLIADDVLATGGTAKAACELIRLAKALPVGMASLMELKYLNGRKQLAEYNFKIYSLMLVD